MTLRDIRTRALAAAEFAAADYRRRFIHEIHCPAPVVGEMSRTVAVKRFLHCYWRYGVQMDVRTAREIVSDAIKRKEIYA